jgi:ribosome-associated toxin RatA of RatAB toxin-antitoxin module
MSLRRERAANFKEQVMKRILVLAAMTLAAAALARPAIDPNESPDTLGHAKRVAAVAALSPGDVRVEQHGDRIWVHAQSDVDADPSTIWLTLSDYDHLAQFIPSMSSSRMISRNGADVVVEQTGTAGFGPIRQKFTVLLAVREELNESITVNAIGGDFRYFDARYDIVPLTPHRSRIVYEATMAPNTPMPSIVTLLVMHSLIDTQFSALVQEVSRRSA